MRNTKPSKQRLHPDSMGNAAENGAGQRQNRSPHTDGDPGITRGRCRVCGSNDVQTFAKIRGVPVHSNVLLPAHAEALQAPIGDLEMKCCSDCGHVYNAAFDAAETAYCSDYENSLFHSETFRTYASSLAAELIERFDLRNKKVVEIGCGSGDFLKLLCDQGGNDGTGFDPSALAGRSIDGHRRITFVRDYYSARHAHLDADLLYCRHVLEHIEQPQHFLKEIREALPEGKRIDLFFEVPDVMFMLKELSSWDFIYEHCSYFSLSSLHRLCSLCGFQVRKIWRTFHGQFLCACVEWLGKEAQEQETAFDFDKGDVARHAEAFSRVFREQVRSWEQRLRMLEREEKKVVLWGAGSKGVTFLNILQGAGCIEYVIDINQQKNGKYIPGTGQHIVSPDFLKEYRPDTVILMNPAYEGEVSRALGDMNLRPKILHANQPDAGG